MEIVFNFSLIAEIIRQRQMLEVLILFQGVLQIGRVQRDIENEMAA